MTGRLIDVRLVEALRAGPEQAVDAERAAGQQRYMRSTMPFRGVPAPVARRLANAAITAPFTDRGPLDRDAWGATIRALYDDAAHREERYAALDLLRHRCYRAHRSAAALPLVEHLVTAGAWWDLVDPGRPVVTEVLLADRTAVEPWLRSRREALEHVEP